MVASAAELHYSLARKQHHFPVQDPRGNRLPHRNRRRRRRELLKNLLIGRRRIVCPRIHQHAHLDASLDLFDERARNIRIVHEPKCGIDFDIFVLNQLD
ncbi:MAG TPA: hypothetical protein VHV29_00035 [Terriglobales bacterium]|nr:hypothetical protein [Terriglobales bacterium]